MKPSQLPSREEIHAAFQQGEEAVLVWFEVQAKIIRDLEARNQALEDQLPGLGYVRRRGDLLAWETYAVPAS